MKKKPNVITFNKITKLKKYIIKLTEEVVLIKYYQNIIMTV